jgi:pilus assembly protein CpaB
VVIYRGSEKADGAAAQVTGAADGAPPLPTVASQR